MRSIRTVLVVLGLTSGCSSEREAERPAAPPAPAPTAVDVPQPAEAPGIDAAPGAVATPSGAPPWLIPSKPGVGACKEVDAGLDCSGTSARSKDRAEGEKQGLEAALAAMAAKVAPGKAAAARPEIEAARGKNPDDVWWEELPAASGGGAELVVYVRVILAAEARAAIAQKLGIL
jgi:hypothetical protein